MDEYQLFFPIGIHIKKSEDHWFRLALSNRSNASHTHNLKIPNSHIENGTKPLPYIISKKLTLNVSKT